MLSQFVNKHKDNKNYPPIQIFSEIYFFAIPEQRYDYEDDLKIVRDTINQIRGAYQDCEDTAIEIGWAEGIEIGEINEQEKHKPYAFFRNFTARNCRQVRSY